MPLRATVPWLRRAAALAALLLVQPWSAPAAHAQRAWADTAWENTTLGDTIPILFTISGGISLGSYQSGVNWGLVRFIRHAHDDAGYRRASHLPDLTLAAMAGASAGNINALISAVAWCSERPGDPPEKSMFWQTWVHTGWEELYPRRRAEWGGVFDRTWFRVGPLAWLAAARDGRVTYPADCDIPIGMTMTRVRPTPINVASNVTASTQRYATLVRVKGSPGGERILFTQPETTLFRPALGALASLGVMPGAVLPDTQVLAALMASSAYPVAFADVTLSYVPGEWVAEDARCAAAARDAAYCGHGQRASFIDGGLFDNNPLALADGLYRADTARRREPVRRRPTIVYINPEALRGELRMRRRPRELKSTDFGGLASLVEVARGAIPAARQYELQAMAREMVDDTRDPRSLPRISTTDRSYPIVSEHLGAFAGFFGKPFRVHDFHAGTYDAMQYVAQHVMCTDSRRRSRGDTTQALDTCVRRELVALIGDTLTFGASPVARAAYEALFRAEFGAPTGLPERAATAEERRRIAVLRELVRANADEFQTHEDCDAGDFVDRALCADGFEGLVQRLATDSVRAAVRDWAANPACDSDTLTDHRGCEADATFRFLMERGPRAFASARLNDVFQQIHNDDRQPAATRMLFGLGELSFRSIDDAYQPDWLADPSTVTAYARRRWHLYPYRVNMLLGGSGTSSIEAGWLPSYRVARGLRVIAPLGLAYGRLHAPTPDAPYHAVLETGLGLSAHPGRPEVHTLDVDWRVLTVSGIANPRWQDRVSYRLLWQPLGGKLSLGYGRLPRAFVPPGGSRNLFSFGLGDVNGLLYYWLRR